ncbi:MAG: hypothetical protein KIT58_08800, partial [Planctomycetota bacterium]|nr:hypothetical protein [Planctomycetota bacterium]
DGRDRRLPPFAAGAVRILAPEPDVSIYYGRGARRSLAAFARRIGEGDEVTPERRDPWTFPGVRRVPAPENLSAADWRRLREAHEGQADAVRLIDRAANNTSLCFIIEVAGKRLMFPGDAELESWEVMTERGVLDGPIDFLKVSHHGSHNGTPLGTPLDTLLPRARRRQSKVLVSTRRDVYGIHNPVPDEALLDELRRRATVYTTEDAVDGHVDIYLDASTDAAPRRPRRRGRRAAQPVAQPDDGTPHGNPFDLARRRTPRPAARPGGARPLNSGEHVWIGSLGAELACRQEKLDGARFESLPRRHAEDRLSYGELVALSGDFYGSPSELYEEQPAALPWLWEPNDLGDLRDMFRAELDWIANDGKSPYPDFNVRMAWNAKSFLELALANTDHFGWHNMAAYCRFHAAALEIAKRAQGRDGETWVRAIYYNAYADHFLTDCFAAGHVRVPRAQIRAWALGRGYSDKLGGALSKLLHDQDGHIGTLHADHDGQTEGLRVANARGEAWNTRCDGQLFLRNGQGDPGAAPAVQIPVQAVAASVGELLRAWRHGALPDGTYAATAFVAFPHPETKPLEQKFSVKAWPKKRLDELIANVQWYSKVPWIGPGVNRNNILELFEALPDLMRQFRATVNADQERNAMLHRRVAPEYLAAYAVIR